MKTVKSNIALYVFFPRGGKEQKVTVLSARLKVKALGQKRFIIALKYEEDDDYRYLAATDVSWRHDYRPVRISSKHMAGRELGRMMPIASLKYRPEYQTLVH